MAQRKPVSSGLEVIRPVSSVDTWSRAEFDSTGADLDISDGTIDLRGEIDALLEQHGHYAFLRRATGQRCACWKQSTQEADPNCSFCAGEGWVYEDVKVLIRKTLIGSQESMTFLNKFTPVGRFAASDQLIWLKYDKKPTRLDKVIEVSLSADGQPAKAHRIEAIWEINWAQDLRDKWGRVEFWACFCHNTGLTK